LSEIPYGDRYEFVAMAMNSGALKPRVANYMFGHYATLCWEVDEFWVDEYKNEPCWALFKRFMKRLEWRRKILKKFPRLVAFSRGPVGAREKFGGAGQPEPRCRARDRRIFINDRCVLMSL
jgi:hypothetical protein